jgi:spermidine/putrescine transport system ATP-binding protein
MQAICKRFGKIEAVDGVTLAVRAGEFFTLLGPSGCGKTTLLRIVAGLEMPDSGSIELNGRNITQLPAAKRQINTVFQSYALFPHLTVFENVAFGLRARKFPEAKIQARVKSRLAMLGLEEMDFRRPHQLSGGQKQRVALARALVNEPEVLLLDEPMSALDARLRAQVQVELKRLQQKLGRTFILVTHDQDEALVVSDRIAVMRSGKVIQFGPPEEVYDNPKTQFVARFLGAANLIQGRRANQGIATELGFLYLNERPPWSKGTVAIRPEWIRICDGPPAKNGIRAEIREIIYRGTDFDLRLEPGSLTVKTHTYKHFTPGDKLWLELAPEELVILDD